MASALRNPKLRRNFSIEATGGTVFRINDNDGQDFTFLKVQGQNVWITDEAFQRALLDLTEDDRRTITPYRVDRTPPLVRALAAISRTDVMTVGITSAPLGLCLNPAIPEGRAAWYSLGFLIRRAATVRLDVAEDELDLGIQPVLDFTSPFAPPSARIFISDTLDNGAGYSTRLGEPAEFEELLQFMLGQLTGPDAQRSRDFFDPIVATTHEGQCSSSCHRCMREFGNMAFHLLLDWRMALDMARLALDPGAPIDLNSGHWPGLVTRIVGPFLTGLGLTPASFGGLPAGVNSGTGEAVILTHPLWDHDPANMRPELASAFAAAERRGLRPFAYSLFRAVRFPYECKEG